MPMTFYDREGKAVAYAEDDVHIYLYSGRPVGYIVEGSLYSFPGRHAGTIRSGWLRDHEGKIALFTDEATASESAGSLSLPEKQTKPRKLLKKTKPPKGRRELPPTRPEDADSWSELSVETLFRG